MKTLKITHTALSILSAVLIASIYWRWGRTIGDPQGHLLLQNLSVFATLALPLLLWGSRKGLTDENPQTRLKWNIGIVAASFAILLINLLVYWKINLSSPLICAVIAWIFLTFFCGPKKMRKYDNDENGKPL